MPKLPLPVWILVDESSVKADSLGLFVLEGEVRAITAILDEGYRSVYVFASPESALKWANENLEKGRQLKSLKIETPHDFGDHFGRFNSAGAEYISYKSGDGPPVAILLSELLGQFKEDIRDDIHTS